jgi:hypothetical protein
MKAALQSLAAAGVDAKTPQDVIEQLPGLSGMPTMLAHGIEGVRYLVAGSRAKGERTWNYAVFDPKTLTILAKNSQQLAQANDASGLSDDDLRDLKKQFTGVDPTREVVIDVGWFSPFWRWLGALTSRHRMHSPGRAPKGWEAAFRALAVRNRQTP